MEARKKYMVHFGVYLKIVAMNNNILAMCNLLCFGVNFDQSLLNKESKNVFIQNSDIAAARLLGCSYG